MFKLRFIVKHNFCGGRYILSHVLLNNWLALEDNLYIYSSLAPVNSSSLYVGILTISNQPVAGYIIFMQGRLTLFLMIVLPRCCYIIDLLYSTIRSTFTESHGFISAMFLDVRCPQRVFIFLNH